MVVRSAFVRGLGAGVGANVVPWVEQNRACAHESAPETAREFKRALQPADRARRAASDRQIATANAAIQRHPERHRARVAVKNAVHRGRLVKGPCTVGVDCLGRIEGHHVDYTKPLEVQWLCKRHHIAADRALRVQAVAS